MNVTILRFINLSRRYVNPKSTQEQLNEAHHSNGSVMIVLLLIVVFMFVAASGAMTTGYDPDKARNNSSWILTGEGEYRR